MTQIVNGIAFRRELKILNTKYDDLLKNMLARLRRFIQANPETDRSNEQEEMGKSLEAHVRAYFLDSFLSLLNWAIVPAIPDAPGELSVEFRVDATYGGKRYYLDYLGFDREGRDPLLLVEAKWPLLLLPFTDHSNTRSRGEDNARILLECLRGHADGLNKDWQKVIEQLSGYLNGLKQQTAELPKRVLLTNGNWFIIFRNPANTFLRPQHASPDEILVIINREQSLDRAEDIYEHLDFHKLSETKEIIPTGRLANFLDPRNIVAIMRGLRLKWDPSSKGHLGPIPQIYVLPILFVLAEKNQWAIVRSERSDAECMVPHKYKSLAEHLDWAENVSSDLYREVCEQAGIDVPIRNLESHLQSDLATSIPLVRRPFQNEDRTISLEMITGQASHFLMAQPSLACCSFHDYGKTASADLANPEANILKRSVHPPSFFISREDHFCAHRKVHNNKHIVVPLTIEGANPREAQSTKRAFCQLLEFEEYLCCRSCIFQETCANSEHFRLPCHSGDR